MRDRFLGVGFWARFVLRARSRLTGKGLVVFAALALVALPTIVRADDAPSLPSFAGASGGGSGGIGADASNGTATARYPIALPPARGVIQPILSLGYAHTARGAVTEVGAGWSLGLPNIERHSRLGGRPKWNGDDIYRLSGARLVQIFCNGPAGAVAGGTCNGEPMPHWSDTWTLYRPDVDSSYTRAFLKADGLTWRIVDRAGAIVELGKPTIMANLTFELGGAYDALTAPFFAPYRWKPVRQFEAYSSGASPKNIILYSWRHWETGDVSTLEDIYYTPPAGVGVESPNEFAHHVHFRYDPGRAWRNPESRFVIEQPWLRSPERIAESIEISSRGVQPSRALVRRYWLTHRPINGRPYLTNVVMEGRCESAVYETSEWDGRRDTMRLPGSSTCPRATPGTSYTYSHGGEVVSGGYVGARAPVKMVFDTPSPSLSHHNLVVVDANRDGLIDVLSGSHVYINGGRAGEPSARQFTASSLTNNTGGQGFYGAGGLSVFGNWDDTWGPNWVSDYRPAPTRADGGPRYVNFLTPNPAGGYAINSFSDIACCTLSIPTMPPPHIFGDLDGDGLSDVIFLDENVSPAVTRARFSNRQTAAPYVASGGAARPFATLGTTNLRLRINSYAPRLAAAGDINGDGITDYITTRAPCAAEPGFPACDTNPNPGHPNYGNFKTLVFIPGRGDGNFGCNRAGANCVPAIASPGYNEFSPGSSLSEVVMHGTAPDDPAAEMSMAAGARFQFADLTGDGRAEAIHFSQDPSLGYIADVWININGNGAFVRDRISFPSGDFNLTGTLAPGETSYMPRVLTGDVDGDGVEDLIVCGDDECVYRSYVPIQPGGLLLRIDHASGATTEIDYHATLREMELEQQSEPSLNPWPDDGAWTSHAPIAVWPVKSVRRHNNAPYPYAVTTRTDYQYRDPMFDRWAGTLRGFRRVRVTTANHSVDTQYYFEGCLKSDAAAQAEVQTHQAPLGVGCQAPELEGGAIANAVNGRPVVVEHLDPTTGTYNSTTAYHYATGNSSGAASFVYVDRVDTFLYDTASYSASPSTETLTSPVGISYTIPIRAPFVMLRRRQTYDSNGNMTFAFDDGRPGVDRPIRTKLDWQPTDTLVPSAVSALGRQYLLYSSTVCYAATTTESCSGSGSIGSGALLSPADQLDGPPRTSSREYDSRGRLKKVMQTILGTVSLNRPTMGAPSPSTFETTVATIFNVSYDDYGNIVSSSGPTNELSTTDYDPQFADHPTTSHVWVGSFVELTSSVQIDRGLGQTIKQTAPTGAESGTDYDGYGRPVRSWVRPSQGTPIDKAAFTYSPFGQVIHWVHASRLATDPANARHAWSFSDSWGGGLATIAQADQTAGDAGEWIVHTAPSRDATTGRPIAWFRPTFYNGLPEDYVVGPPAGTLASTAAYDFMGRPVDRFRGHDGQIVDHRQYHALSSDHWDAENLHGAFTHLEMATTVVLDGHGRTSEVRKLTENGPISTVTDYTATGELAVLERREGANLKYRRWMRHDSRGLVVENAEPNTSTGFVDSAAGSSGMKGWRYTYDRSGRLTGTRDARGCGKNIVYDQAGRPLAEDYSPCISSVQQGWSSYDPVTGNGSEVLYKYDSPEPGQTTDYGGNIFALRGKLVSIRDRGAHTRFAYDGLGRVIGTARRIAKPGVPSNTIANRYTSHWFRTATVFDEVDRPQVTSTGADVPELLTGAPWEVILGSSYLEYHYSGRDAVAHVGGSYGTLLESQRVAADGATEMRLFGDANGTQAFYGYDDERRLQTHDLAQPNGGSQFKLISHVYSHDEVGNITEMIDGRDTGYWLAGAKPVSRTMSYDSLYRLRTVHFDHQGDEQVSPLQAEEAASDPRPVPRIASATRVVDQSFNYDSLGNVTEAHDESSTSFDRGLGIVQMGDRNAGSDELRKPNRLLYADGAVSPGGVDAHYDAAGNLADLAVERVETCAAPSGKCSHRFVYDWNEVGQLVRARRWDYTTIPVGEVYPAAPVGPASVELSYKYSQGTRVVKTSPDPSGNATHTVDVFGTLRLSHADFIGGEYVRDASTETVRLPGFGRAQYAPGLPNAGSDLHVFLEFGDHLGNATVVIDKDTSQLVEYATYLAYGATETDYRPAEWQGFREPHRFTGKEEDVEVGLTYFGARYYSPYLTRFISPDPLTIHAVGADLNPYAYVGGHVFNATDPFGLESNYTPNPTSSDGTATQSTGPGPDGLGTWETKEFCGCNMNPHYADGRSNESNNQVFAGPPPPPPPSLAAATGVHHGRAFSVYPFDGAMNYVSPQEADAREAADLQRERYEIGMAIAEALALRTVNRYEAIKTQMVIGAVEGFPVIGPLMLAAEATNENASMGHRMFSGGLAVAAMIPVVGVVVGEFRAGAVFEPAVAALPEYTGGKVAGMLHVPGEVSQPLLSGVAGPSQAVRGLGLPGFNGNQLMHVEGHAAASMRTNGVSNAVLDINKVPCVAGRGGGCTGLLPRMLPEGATLRVRGPDGYDEVFTGLPD